VTNNARQDPKATVLYDQDCGFCQQQTDRLRRWDRQGRFNFVPSQSDEAHAKFPQAFAKVDVPAGDQDGGVGRRTPGEMKLVDEHGNVHGGAMAVREILRRLPRMKFLAWPLSIPGTQFIWQWLYRRVANNRHRFGSATCELPQR